MAKVTVRTLKPLVGNDAEEHRSFLKETGEILSGTRPISEVEEDSIIYVYRIPAIESMYRYPRLRQMPYGRLDWDDSGVVFIERGTSLYEVRVFNKDAALDFLNDLMHLIEDRRRSLAVQANAEMSNTRDYNSATGVKGNLIKEYDALLDQLTAERFYQSKRTK